MAARIWAHELARVCNARGLTANWLRAANIETVCQVQSQLSSQRARCVAFELSTEGAGAHQKPGKPYPTLGRFRLKLCRLGSAHARSLSGPRRSVSHEHC